MTLLFSRPENRRRARRFRPGVDLMPIRLTPGTISTLDPMDPSNFITPGQMIPPADIRKLDPMDPSNFITPGQMITPPATTTKPPATTTKPPATTTTTTTTTPPPTTTHVVKG